uniref:Copia protein n=1 Tax=Tanacetum cinerariifolium TaxID=118510 RepID=A0A6L2MA48_TANCI|nr:copia protein [Tanacetum cinerariifolium]
MDERGIVIRNKARIVAQGHTQEEGIDYDEMFVLVARIEAIRLFLAYSLFNDFIVYQMDVKSAFLYEKIKEEVYVFHPPRFEDPDFSNKVYKVEKALYGLHQTLRAWHDLKLNDAEGTSCLSNAVIFKELARIGAKTTLCNEFSSTAASATICLANNQKFNFSKYILDNLKKNLEACIPFYMFPRFIQVFVNHQLGYMSHHKGIFVNPSLTKKVFANIKRVGTWFYEVITPLFGTMMVQALEEVGDLPITVQDTPIPDVPSSSQHQRKHKPRRKERKETEISPIEIHTEDHVPTTSNDLLPSGEDRMKLKELMNLYTNLSNKVLDLENEVIKIRSSHKAKIKELESKEESSKQGRKITDIDVDAEVNLENVYNLDIAHEEVVLSMQDVTDADVKEVVEEMVEVTEIAKIIVDEVITAGGELNAANEKPVSVVPTNITIAQPSEATKTTIDITTTPKAKGIVFHDKEESTTRTASSKSQVKDKGKAKLVEELEIQNSRKAQIVIDEEVARRIEVEWNTDMKDNIDWNKVVEQVQSRQSDAVRKYQALKRKPVSVVQARKNMMKQKLEEQQEAKELKKNLKIVSDDEDDVFVNVTPLSSKPPTIVDYKIYKEEKKEHF